MPSETNEFFEGKRPWSRIKDQILRSYITQYVAKVVTKGQPLLLIDAFAGPGVFGEGEAGSPLIICHAAKKFAQGRYKAIFVNKEPEYHQKLQGILEKGGWAADATAILGDA